MKPEGRDPATDMQLGLLEQMQRQRAFEELASRAHEDGALPGLLHLSSGAEATTVGVLAQLGSGDRIYSSHRPHGHFLISGVSPRELYAELAGKETGLCRGRGGSMHLMSDRAVMASGVVGSTLPIALGHALTLPEPAVAAVFFGDGAVQTGTFHETLNMAALWSAPVLFVCENNGWAEFSAREEHTTVERVADHGETYGIASATIDGSDVAAVRWVVAELLGKVRVGKGPALLECMVSRLRAHYEGDPGAAAEAGPDPITVAEEQLADAGVPAEHLTRVRVAAEAEMHNALEEALAAPAADPEIDPDLVFAGRPT